MGTLTKGGMTSKATVQDVVLVKHHDGPIMLPESMRDQLGNTDYDAAIKAFMDAKAHEAQTTVFSAKLDVFPWEAALEMPNVLEEMFGSATVKTKTYMTFFGPVTEHPQAREIKVGPKPEDIVLIPWGAPFRVPGLDEVELTIANMMDGGRLQTQISSEVKRKHQPVLQSIVEKLRDRVARFSIYRHKILQLQFDGDMPIIDFIDLDAKELGLVYNRDVEKQLRAHLHGFIKHPDLWAVGGLGSKRGALFVGPYGTGKSAQIRAIMREAVRYGWTCVYLKDAKDIAKAMPYIARWGRTVLGAEDIDKVANKDTPQDKVQALSLILDGVTSYAAEVQLICTSNNLDHIHPILRRHGRFDITVLMGLPNPEAGERLLKLFAGNLLAEGADLQRAGRAIAGLMPSTIREVINRAKAYYIERQGNLDFALTGDDMYHAAVEIATEQGITQQVDKTPRSKDEIFGFELGKGLSEGIDHGVRTIVASLRAQSEDGHGERDEILSLPAGVGS